MTVENEFDDQAGEAADPPPLLTTVRTVRDILDLGDITSSQLCNGIGTSLAVMLFMAAGIL